MSAASTPAREEALDQYLADRGTSGLFTRLARVGLLLQSFQEGCLGPFGLRFIDFSVLRVLELAGPPYCMSPTRLSQIVLRPTGGVTQILDRLQRDGWIERSPDPSDRRKIIVALTEAGLELSRRANQRYAEARAGLLGDLTDAEVEAIDSALRRLLDAWGEPA
jgi:DNA-binding MarR family transcriptional regulator